MGKKVSVILPCRNERDTIRGCIREIRETARASNLDVEIVVSDSSNDGSDAIAREEGVVLVKHDTEGYGFAVREGMKQARGEILVYADADGTYSFKEFPKLVEKLKEADIAIGSRFKGTMERGSMPAANRFLGTPVLNALLLVFFGIRISDSQSGYRAMTQSAFEQFDFRTNGMEFATEMIVKAKELHLTIAEVPIAYAVRKGTSKLRRYHDGIAHLRYIFLKMPFLWYAGAGLLFFVFGILSLLLKTGSATTRLFFPIIGFEIAFLGIFAKTSLWVRFHERNKLAAKFNEAFRFKTGTAIGLALILVPLALRAIGFGREFFDILFVSAMLGILLIANLFMLSLMNSNENSHIPPGAR